jgi:hypothetical protein
VRIYEVGPIAVSGGKKVLILANVIYASDANNLYIVVGRADVASAAGIDTTNLVKTGALVDEEGNFTQLCLASNSGNAEGVAMNLSGHVIDNPDAGTYYYSLWMGSNGTGTYGLGTSLSVLLIG